LAFALANDLVIEGIAIVSAISAGMALTLSAMGLIAIYSSGMVNQRISAPSGATGLRGFCGQRVVRSSLYSALA